MFNLGLVKAQDAVNCRVRVIFPHRSQMQSYWLPVLVPKSQNDKAYWMPDIGEMVVCLMDQHFEDGAVLGAIYSSTDTPPASSADKYHWTFKDGATFDYDRAAHVLAIALGASATMTITAHGATIQIDSSGNVAVLGNGTINVQAPTVQVNGTSSVVLAGGGPAVARVGDRTTCPAGSGTITSGSAKVTSG
jgi:phage baseplate assembly protein V